jgi:hypothetical protein
MNAQVLLLNPAATSELDVSAVFPLEPKRSETRELTAAIEAKAALFAKINADLAHSPRAGMTPAERKRDFARSQIRSAKASLANLREAVDFTARTWGWPRSAAVAAHRQHADATMRLVAMYRRNAAEAFAEARKLEAEAEGVFRASLKAGVQ